VLAALESSGLAFDAPGVKSPGRFSSPVDVHLIAAVSREIPFGAFDRAGR
jgi:hypothetical protein